MTLSLAWERTLKGNRTELVVASDSRLSGGQTWDCGPKIMTLPRSDSLICFAGETDYAYPLMIQMASAIEHYPKSRDRSYDLTDMKGHTVRVFNQMVEKVENFPVGSNGSVKPESVFLLAGYSWKKKKFYIWLLHYDEHIQKYTFRPASPWDGVDGYKKIMFAGDEVESAKDKLITKLRNQNKLESGGLDLEPLEVLIDMIRDDQYPTIGGPPQVMKVYEHMNTLPYMVYWPNRESGKLSLLGRPLLEYERTRYLALDPDSLESVKVWEYVEDIN